MRIGGLAYQALLREPERPRRPQQELLLRLLVHLLRLWVLPQGSLQRSHSQPVQFQHRRLHLLWLLLPAEVEQSRSRPV
jgi:hypothetical protein